MKIFNASPLILILEEIDEPDLLEKFFIVDKGLLVPDRVNREITSKKAREKLDFLIKTGKLKICDNGCNKTFQFLKNRFPTLDDGELTVISLAYRKKANWCSVIIDEEIGRAVARKLGLNLKGVFGLIMELYDKGIIDKERLCNTCRKIDKSTFRINFKGLGYRWVTK